MTIERIATPLREEDLCDLELLLGGCVAGGASIGFLWPLGAGEARRYWQTIAADLTGGRRMMLVARDEGRIVGAVQLAFETRPNGRHRAEVQKLLVLPAHRRRGIARRLMEAIETMARAHGVRLLYLDTSEGTSGARAFYDAQQYVYVGGIPDYALDPDGTPAANAIYYKTLAPRA